MNRHQSRAATSNRRRKSGLDPAAQFIQSVRWHMSNCPGFDYEIRDNLANTHLAWDAANAQARSGYSSTSQMKKAYFKKIRSLIELYNTMDKTCDDARQTAYKICQMIKWLLDKGCVTKDDRHRFGVTYASF